MQCLFYEFESGGQIIKKYLFCFKLCKKKSDFFVDNNLKVASQQIIVGTISHKIPLKKITAELSGMKVVS